MVGREKEISDLLSLLKNPQVGLITLHGFGGSGKTRLAVEVGRAALELFPDGVWFVTLAPVSLPQHIITATAAAMGFSFPGLEDQKSQLLRYLRDKQLLLIFDNLEHLLPEGATYVEELLQNVTGSKLLVTSRQPLNVIWEWVYPLHGLQYEASSSVVEENIPAAVQLFLQQLSRAGAPASDNDPACAAQICQIVRGLPLALLLAASWGRALGCDEIFHEIRRGIGFLHAWQQTFPEKHSSMQAVFEYSWRLLSDEEQTVLRKLAVFRGGFDRSAATEVTGAQLPLLAHLVDQSLVERSSNDRYQIHELLRQYLLERLVEAGEERTTRDQHLAYYTRLAEQAEPELVGKNHQAWINKLQTEIDNIRVALDWSLASKEWEKGLTMMSSIEQFWLHPTYSREGYQYLTRLLQLEQARVTEQPSAIRARGLNLASALALFLEDFPQTRRLAEEALRIGRELNESRLIGDAYYHLGDEAIEHYDLETARPLIIHAIENYEISEYWNGLCLALDSLGRTELFSGNFSEAFRHLSKAVDIAKKQENAFNLASALMDLGALAHYDPRLGNRKAREYLLAALDYSRKLGNKRLIAFALMGLAEAERAAGEYEKAIPLLEEVDLLEQEMGRRGQARVIPQLNLGFIYLRLGRFEEAKEIFWDNFALCQSLGLMKIELYFCLLGLTAIEIGQGKAQLAAQILGCLEAQKVNITFAPLDLSEYEHILSLIKAHLPEKQLNQLLKEGQALSLIEAAQLIQREGNKENKPDAARLDRLTKREIEILSLVAQGLSDAQVAERLVLSPRTVNAHLTSIYNKLGVNSRSAATRYAVEHGLA